MAFSLHHYGSAPLWGVKFAQSPVHDGAAVITSATFSTSSQKYETVNDYGQKIGALVYDSECSFSLQVTLLAASAAGCTLDPLAVSCNVSPFLSGATVLCENISTNSAGLLASVTAPTWVFSGPAGSALSPVIDSMEFSMSNTSARTASISGTIYAF